VRVLGPNDKTIGGLGAASALAGADLVPVVQGGTTKKATFDQVGTFISRALYNASLNTPGAGFAADTYLVGSEILIPTPATQLKAKSMYRARFSVAKTGAGAAAPVITLRYGTLGTVSDAALNVFTFPAQTAVVDEGLFEVYATFRSVGIGTTAVIAGVARLTHDNGAAGTSAGTGLSVQSDPTVIVTSAGFNSTVANSIIALSVNGGTSAVWTIAVVQSELINLA
jgi:hypothetical protein